MASWADLWATQDELAKVRQRVKTLFAAIEHGDAAHRAWLKQAIEDHFAGRPVQRQP